MIVILKVHMHCEACSQEIKRRIERIKGMFFFLSGSLVARIHLIRWISRVSGIRTRPLHIIMHCPTNWAMLTGRIKGMLLCFVLKFRFSLLFHSLGLVQFSGPILSGICQILFFVSLHYTIQFNLTCQYHLYTLILL